ncbi:FecR domain-containing protein [Marinomonas sp. 5E14-1]|uniref:FecR domain-containing protein n=1 Tax=Marinomonas sp. 5E14-1 TaxID=3153922 RepID=UPI003265475B
MSKVSKKSMHEAADWLVRQQEKELTKAEGREFELWQHSCDSNRLAWQRAQSFISRVDSLPKDIAGAVLNRPDDESRRFHMRKLALLLVSGPFLWGSYKVVESQHWSADYRTAKGQKKQVTLPDGTIVTLNTATAFDASFDQNRRLLSLREGEIEVNAPSTHYNGVASFTVKTKEAVLSLLDTNLTVRKYRDFTRVGVIEGQALISPIVTNNVSDSRLEAGLQVDVSNDGVLSKKPLLAGTTSWLANMLAVHNMPLNTFIEELSRYHTGLFRVSPDIQNIEVSGAFPVKDINIVFNMLSNTYPINIKQNLSRYWVTLEAV